jgi:cytochrome c oxidase subunit 4
MVEEHKHPNYMAIFWILLALTVLEVAAAKLPAWMGDGWWTFTVVLLILMALAKALYVALFFMHLKFERKTVVLIVCAPVVLAVVLVVGLLPDVAFQVSEAALSGK